MQTKNRQTGATREAKSLFFLFSSLPELVFQSRAGSAAESVIQSEVPLCAGSSHCCRPARQAERKESFAGPSRQGDPESKSGDRGPDERRDPQPAHQNGEGRLAKRVTDVHGELTFQHLCS